MDTGPDALIAAGLEAVAADRVDNFVRGRFGTRATNPFDYAAHANRLLSSSRRVLDHGTGNGATLASLAAPADLLVATEDTPFLVTDAATTLAHRASVVRTSPGTHDVRGPNGRGGGPDRSFPFRSESFDAFLAASASFSPNEAFRLLRPGGSLLYIGGLVAPRPGHLALETLVDPELTYDGAFRWEVRDSVIAAGFTVEEYHEFLERTLYYDIAAIVARRFSRYAQSKGLRVDAYRDRLHTLHDLIAAEGRVETAWTTVAIVATKPR